MPQLEQAVSPLSQLAEIVSSHGSFAFGIFLGTLLNCFVYHLATRKQQGHIASIHKREKYLDKQLRIKDKRIEKLHEERRIRDEKIDKLNDLLEEKSKK